MVKMTEERGLVVKITGPRASGKTTLAFVITQELAKLGYDVNVAEKCEILIHEAICKDPSFQERLKKLKKRKVTIFSGEVE